MNAALTPGLYPILAGNAMLLVGATALIATLKHLWSPDTQVELVRRVNTWWVIFVLFTLALLGGRGAFVLLMCLISFLAIKEYFSLIPGLRTDRCMLLIAYLAVPLQYLLVFFGISRTEPMLGPIIAFGALQICLLLRSDPEFFLPTAGQLHWGLLTGLLCLSHLAYLRVLPPEPLGAGLVLYVVLLTELNDVAQYLWGKLSGRHKVTPRLSPNKTWEGLAGGIATTIALAVLLGPVITPFSLSQAIVAGGIIGIAGFFGDLNISALKRGLGRKDTGQLLPGHGGILDRVDSLMFTAPAFYYFIVVLIQRGLL